MGEDRRRGRGKEGKGKMEGERRDPRKKLSNPALVTCQL